MDAQEHRLVAGRYRLLAPLGTGGMGTVWRAEDSVLGRAVAVKEVVFPHGLSDEDRDVLRERTRREARAAARLDHPSAVTVFDVVEEEGRPYLVLELVEARTLSQVVRADGPLTPQATARVGLRLLGALEAAHRQGIVHRDVKPGNVLLGEGYAAEGRVVLTDFGIASSAGDSSITSTGLLLGSPSYIAPERARGRPPAPASDLWSLGATLFTAVEGRPPFDGGDPLTTVTAVVTGDSAPFERAGPLEPVLTGLLEREPEQRMTPAAARAALQAVADGGPSPDPAPTLAVPVVAGPALAGPVVAGPVLADVPAASRTTALPVDEVREAADVPGAAPQAAPAWDRPARPARRGRSRLPLVLAALAALLAAGVVALVLATDPERTLPDALGGDPAASEPADAGDPSAAPLPEGWGRYEDPAGWSVGVPPGWVRTTYRDTQVQLRDPDTRRTLRIDVRPAGSTSPLEAFAALSPQLAAQLASYAELRLESVDLGDDAPGEDPAELEFTYFDETGLHVVDRGFTTSAGDRVALYWQVPEQGFDDSLPELDEITATFDGGA